MWQNIFMIIAVSLAIYSIYDFSLIIVKKIIITKQVSKKIYRFEGKIRYYPLIGAIILIINLSGLIRNNTEKIIVNKYFFSGILQRFQYESAVFNKIIIGIFSVLLVINYIFSRYITPIMYEEGIMCENGNFLSWDRIKSINTVQNSIRNKKYIVINTVNKEIYLRVTTEEINRVKEFIFNKTGIVNKDIVTEFN